MADTVNHFRIEKGAPCERLSGGVWEPFVLPRRLWHVRCDVTAAGWVFHMPVGTVRVPPEHVGGSGARLLLNPEPHPEPVLSVTTDDIADTVVLTRELLNAARNGDAYFTNAQFALFGMTQPLGKGWLDALVGRRVPRELYDRFLALKKNPKS